MIVMDPHEIWVTSDTHFNHANIIKYCNRPFLSVEEMNDVIINNWNDVVPKEATVYHLGDFALGDKSLIPDLLNRLNGHIKLVMGNHDNYEKMINCVYSGYINSVSWEEVIKVEKKIIIMNHYPFSSLPDPNSNYSTIQLHGHVHSTPDKQWSGFSNQYDVGVDNNNFKPVNLYELIHETL